MIWHHEPRNRMRRMNLPLLFVVIGSVTAGASCTAFINSGSNAVSSSHQSIREKNDRLYRHQQFGGCLNRQTCKFRANPSSILSTTNDLRDHTVRENFFGTNVVDHIISDMIQRNELRVSSFQVAQASNQQSNGKSAVMAASAGVQVWRRVLTRGRIPVPTDFDKCEAWPTDPVVYESIMKAMNNIDLPRMVLKHPDTVNAVLITMLRILSKLDDVVRANTEYSRAIELDDDVGDEFHEYELVDEIFHDLSQYQDSFSMVDIADEVIVGGFMNEWGGVVRGVHTLDNLFGIDHGVLDINGQRLSSGGVGLSDGIWQHTGWNVLPKLQRQLASMTELRDLMKSIGRRPTSENSNAINKFPSSKINPDGAPGAQFDPSIRTSVSGLMLSNKLSDMLPSEAVLLKSSSAALRRLFFAKVLESKLLSYEVSGWADIPSVPRSRSHLTRKPSGPGGPLILCLDTSWSMSGVRETLSKAVTLACVSAAHKQGRDCRVVAFSNSNGVMEAGKITADSEGIRRLLDFLSNSFVGGGTDVTGALKHVMNTTDPNSLSAADILLVTDGEIPDPPVSEETMSDLRTLNRQTGMQIHGLLVGRNESKPLSKLCTQVHDFLSGYEEKTFGAVTEAIRFEGSRSRISTQLKAFGFRASSHAQQECYLPAFSGMRSRGGTRHFKKSTSSLILRARQSPDNDSIMTSSGKNQRIERTNDDDSNLEYSAFNSNVDSTVENVMAKVENSLTQRLWKAESLDAEKYAHGSCWRYTEQLKAAVAKVSEGLIERDEESKLVVLAMISMEHLLLLGPPGTAKSALGRRVSKLCGGQFFQRLLTKFTTPEEIFGPLSLRSLENDEYRRCTDGFLPTASVAFLDEIFKANSAILNTLLTILNERKFDNGAGFRQNCPIQCVVGASNELPESDDLDALYDRFLLRKEVKAVSDDGLTLLLSMPSAIAQDSSDYFDPTSATDSVFVDGLDSIVQALSTAADMVQIGPDVAALIRDLRHFLKDDLDVDISDRRLVKAARLLRISAASHGRMSVDTLDCLLLENIAWRLPEQRRAIKDWLWEHLTPGGESPFAAVEPFRVLLDGLSSEASLALRKTSGDITGAFGARDADVALIQSIAREILQISEILQDRLVSLSRHAEIVRRSDEHLWISSDEARAVMQQLLPKAENVANEIRKSLVGALALHTILIDETVDSNARLASIEMIWDDSLRQEIAFTDEELLIGMKEAKAKYEGDTFRAWKRARKKAAKAF